MNYCMNYFYEDGGVMCTFQLIPANFFFTAFRLILSMPQSSTHKSLAHGLILFSEQQILLILSFQHISLLRIFIETNKAAELIMEGLYFSILYSISGSSIRYQAKLKAFSSAPRSLEYRCRNLYEEGAVTLNSNVRRTSYSNFKMSFC